MKTVNIELKYLTNVSSSEEDKVAFSEVSPIKDVLDGERGLVLENGEIILNGSTLVSVGELQFVLQQDQVEKLLK
jgi:hypothetical protein